MRERVAVIGGGIVGVAHAWREAQRGAQVTLYERGRHATGASVRNFGMVWPIGQPPARREAALLSRSLWDEFVRETGVWSAPNGSLHVAKREDELAVLTDFESAASALCYDCELLDAEAVARLCPAASNGRLLGGLFSPTEMGVDPREVIAAAPAWLQQRYGVSLRYGETVVSIAMPSVTTSDGARDEFDRVTVASGADFATLYPEVFADNRLSSCKLQMMRTVPQPERWRLGPMVAGGLTLRHYPTFASCPSLAALTDRIARETPELDRYGIHVMAAQNGRGEVVLGDSHEYGDVEPFDKGVIEHYMLRELHSLIDLPTWDLEARWHGVYAIQPNSEVQFVHEPEEGVEIVIATGGTGMTMSFGLAEQRVAARGSSPALAAEASR